MAHSKLKILMTFFDHPKHKQKLYNLHHNILELKVHLESKLTLIQWLDKEDWIKPMYIEYIIHIFLTAIGLHARGS